MLWSGKLFIVRVTVDTYAMVGVNVDSGYRRSEIARSGNTRGAVGLSFATESSELLCTKNKQWPAWHGIPTGMT